LKVTNSTSSASEAMLVCVLPVVQGLVVDLVGKTISWCWRATSTISLQQAVGVQRAGRVVRVDDHDALGARRDLARMSAMSGIQSACLVADVVHRRAAGQRHRRRPQRVVGRGHQDLVAVVEQRVQAHHDQLGGAVAQVDVVHRHALDALFLAVVHHRLARREQALAVGVAGGVRQVADHVLHDLVGRLQPEHGQVADVELDDLVALFLHLAGLVQHGPTDVVADVGELAGLGDGLQTVDAVSVNGESFAHSSLVSPVGPVQDWPVASIDELQEAHFRALRPPPPRW
jgi:hypothetical protein